MRIGADTGGTFSDLVTDDGRILKVLSTPSAPDAAVREGVGQLAGSGDRPSLLAHGTTVATNAVLEGALAGVVLVCNDGLVDVIEIGRQDRPSLYDQWADRPAPLVPRDRRVGVVGRLAADGRELTPLDVSSLGEVPEGVVVAVCLLHADIEPAHEVVVAEHLRSLGHEVVASHESSPEYREFERTVTTVVDAGLRPLCRDYLLRLDQLADQVSVMTSAGGLLDARVAADRPAALLLSGPAGGVRAAAAVAVACGHPDAITFDMGGTSTDVCLVQEGEPAFATTRHVGGYLVRYPSLDIHTIGAGGGSIAAIDVGGALVVGPASAGADPGPASYGRGGELPTVTDANVVLGRIPAQSTFGTLQLDRDAAVRALNSAGVEAEGIIEVVNANMVRALRAVSVERGVDPSSLALVAFGGAGALHACALADEMGMSTVIIPARAGVLSAVGLLAAPPRREVVRSRVDPAVLDGLDDELAAVAADARALAGAHDDVVVEIAVDCRYAGQSHELTVVDVASFHGEHEHRNGFARPDAPVEVVAVRVAAMRPPALAVDELPIPPHRVSAEECSGPRVIAEPDCTIWLAEGWTARPGPTGALGAHTECTMTSPTLDPAKLQVLISKLTGVAEEMGAVLQRSAFSPNIKERADCSAALFTPDGTLLVQAEHIPVHLGSMPASVAAVIAAFDGRVVAGEQYVVNDPFAGGTHLNDITVVAPCILDDRLVGWAANRAHHADVGGSAPGSMPADAHEIFEEGLRLPPVRLTDDIRSVLFANSRTPVERAGDLDAQVGANALGVRRLAELADAPVHEVVDYGERRMRSALTGIDDGSWSATDVMDSTGSGVDQQRPSEIRVRLDVMGDRLRVDFTGSAPQSDGNVNAVAAVTESAVAFAIRSVIDPTMPANGGALRPIEVVLPPGSIVAADAPAAVGAGNVEVSQRVADLVLAVLAQADPERVAAANQGTMNNLLLGGRGWVYYETVGGGQGGRWHDGHGMPGQSGIQTGMTNTKNTPIEALERAFPLRVLRYRLRRGSGGGGRAPGGDGIERDLQVLEDVTASLITERRVSRPAGLAGGEPGSTGENWLLPQGDESRAERLPDKCTIRLEAGDVLRMLTPGGGGWGARSET
ncbi:hydantoinase B/oxoprolinase family protein [Actinospongicola halichondriae]|uniref:hydantoinase B/oxoprolinase family protein n=1 Tax=Actinospongicola halichondriae TaxID=3236844 RepID=UPI003D59E48D